MGLATAKRVSGYSPGPALRMHLISDLPSAADITPYLERIDAKRWYTNFGPLVREFELKIAALLAAADTNPQNGAIHLTTMTSCYQALETGLRFLELPEGGKVLVPAITFPGCAHAVRHAGGEIAMSPMSIPQAGFSRLTLHGAPHRNLSSRRLCQRRFMEYRCPLRPGMNSAAIQAFRLLSMLPLPSKCRAFYIKVLSRTAFMQLSHLALAKAASWCAVTP